MVSSRRLVAAEPNQTGSRAGCRCGSHPTHRGTGVFHIGALLAMAGADLKHGFVTAPLFLRKRHLTQRMRALLLEVPMSKLRLLSSYAAMVCILSAAGWLVLVSFPLIGQSQIQEVSTADGGGISVDPGGSILHRNSIFYPWQAQQNRIEGTVTVALTLNARGEVVDARVLSGPDELRKDVLQSVLQWHYAADGSASRTIQARIDFRIPETTSKDNGSVPGGVPPSMDHGILESIDVSNLPESLRADVWQRVVGFKRQPFSDALISQVENAVNGADSHLRARWEMTQDQNHTLKFVFDSAPGEQQNAGNAADSGVHTYQVGGVYRVGGGVSLPITSSSTPTLRLNADGAIGQFRTDAPQYAELARKAQTPGGGAGTSRRQRTKKRPRSTISKPMRNGSISSNNSGFAGSQRPEFRANPSTTAVAEQPCHESSAKSIRNTRQRRER